MFDINEKSEIGVPLKIPYIRKINKIPMKIFKLAIPLGKRSHPVVELKFSH